MAEKNGASLSERESLFLRAYDLRVGYGVNVNGVADHLHYMNLKTSEARPLRLASRAYMKALGVWSRGLQLPINASVASYFATTESAHRAITYTEENFNKNLENTLMTDGEDSRFLSVARVATLFEVTISGVRGWISDGRIDATSESKSLRVSEENLRDFYQWQYPENYEPDATVRML